MKYALITIFLLALIPVASASGQGTNTQATLGYPILLKFRASTSYENPLNTTQVNVTAFFSSQGSSFSLPCYPYAKGIWGVRFTPTALSTYTYRVVLTNSSGAFVIGGGEISVSAGPKPMPEAEAGKSYFHAGGSPLVLVGEDVAWASSPGDSAGGWEYYVGKLAENGGNWVRLWSPYAATWFSGNYSAMLDFALKNRVYVQLCLFSPYTDQSFYEGPEWFNVAPAAFFSSPKMIKLEEFWIRSLVGKYSAFPNLFSWELFNEVDGAPGYNSTAVAAWTRAMVSYIEKNDPYRHMITISVSNPEEGFSLFSIPGISYAQLHLYGSGPYAIPSNISYWVGQYMSFHKPILVAEFGASYISAVNDPVGISLQLGLWSAIASGSAGTAMTWWWDSFVDPNDLYFQFQAVRNLVSQLNFFGFRPLDVSSSSGSAEAVGNGTAAIIFLVNSSLASDWANYYELGRATSAKVALRMQPGSYWLERWNPTTGSVTNASVITVGESGTASFSLPLSSDAVITITKDHINATPASSSFGTLSFFSTSAVPVYIYSRDRLLIEEVRANERGTNVSLPYGYYLVNQSKVVLDHQSSPMIFYYSPFIAYSTLTLSQAKVPEGEALTLTCALVSANGTPVSGALVNFYAGGQRQDQWDGAGVRGLRAIIGRQIRDHYRTSQFNHFAVDADPTRDPNGDAASANADAFGISQLNDRWQFCNFDRACRVCQRDARKRSPRKLLRQRDAGGQRQDQWDGRLNADLQTSFGGNSRKRDLGWCDIHYLDPRLPCLSSPLPLRDSRYRSLHRDRYRCRWLHPQEEKARHDAQQELCRAPALNLNAQGLSVTWKDGDR